MSRLLAISVLHYCQSIRYGIACAYMVGSVQGWLWDLMVCRENWPTSFGAGKSEIISTPCQQFVTAYVVGLQARPVVGVGRLCHDQTLASLELPDSTMFTRLMATLPFRQEQNDASMIHGTQCTLPWNPVKQPQPLRWTAR